MSKRLSVVTTNYNDSSFLKERIPSILSQLGPSDELIFVDDASTDSSLQIVDSFAKQDSRLKVIRNLHNLGVVKSANIGMKASQGKYLASLAADDRIMPGFVEKTLTPLLNHSEYGICFSDCSVSYDGFPDKDPHKIYTDRLFKNATETQYFPANQLISIFQANPFWIPGHTAIFKRSLFFKYGGLNESLGPLCDWFVFHAIALESGAIYVPGALAIWRQASKSYAKELQMQKRGPSYQRELLKLLKQPEFRRLGLSFQKAKLTHYYVLQNLGWVILRPRHWDFLLSWICHVLSHPRKSLQSYLKRVRFKSISRIFSSSGQYRIK